MTTPSPIDRAAFDLAIEAARNESPARRQQIDSMLAHGEDYVSVGRFAAQCCQMIALDLAPWQLPPCYADMSASALSQPYGDTGARRESAELALRMRRCGVSRWHPNPARECDRIESEQRQQGKAKETSDFSKGGGNRRIRKAPQKFREF